MKEEKIIKRKKFAALLQSRGVTAYKLGQMLGYKGGMWVNADVFMKLVQSVTELKGEVKMLSAEVETLKKRPLIVERKRLDDEDADAEVLLDELLNGKADEQGRVIYTDGRK